MSQEGKSDHELALEALDKGLPSTYISDKSIQCVEEALASKSTQISELKAEVNRLNSFYKESVRIDEDSEKKLSELKAEVEVLKKRLEQREGS